MNSKEFEIINSKLDMIFDELEHFRHDYATHIQEMKERSLESKFEDAQRELNWGREGRDYINRYYDDVRSNYRSIERNVEDRYEYRMREAIERGTKMHAPEYMEEKR